MKGIREKELAGARFKRKLRKETKVATPTAIQNVNGRRFYCLGGIFDRVGWSANVRKKISLLEILSEVIGNTCKHGLVIST